MKKKLNKKIILGVIIAPILLIVVMFAHFQAIEAQSVNFEIAGWLYSENFDWISLSSKNCELIFNQNPSIIACEPAGGGGSRVEYGVNIDDQNEITGYGWSGKVGWVCFGATCTGSTPAGGASTANLEEASAKIDGWAQILSLGDEGWIRLRAPGTTAQGTSEFCYNCEPACTEWTQDCAGDPEVCVDVEPCLAFSEDEYDQCQTCFTRTKFDNENLPDTGFDSVIGGSGYICSNCTGNGSQGSEDQFCHESSELAGTSRITCSDCSDCQDYGVSSNPASGQLVGWAWNGDDTGTVGAGWIQFHSQWGAGIVYPWLETQYGSIYSFNEVRQRAGSAAYNSTYCIIARDIKNVSSARCDEEFVPGVDIAFPTVENQSYYNALGKVDIVGITTPIYVIMNKNKYGNIVETIDDTIVSNWGSSKVLENKVYVSHDSLTIGSDLTFENAPSGSMGNGTIVVEGDLIVDATLAYGSGAASNLDQLASVAWVVEGDIIVKETITDMAGAFIALGDGGTCVSDGASFPIYTPNSCGVLYSGRSSEPLTITGLAIARAFDFRRLFADVGQGSERVIYDGRLIANPPPGLEGFSEGLPVIRDFSF